jgi:hypothetical protein
VIKPSGIFILEAALACADLVWDDFGQGPADYRFDRASYRHEIEAALAARTLLDPDPTRFQYVSPKDCNEVTAGPFYLPEAVDDFYVCGMKETQRSALRECLDLIRGEIQIGRLKYLATHQIALDEFQVWWHERRVEGTPVPRIFQAFWRNLESSAPKRRKPHEQV